MQPLVTTNINEKINQKSQRQNLINQKGAAPITDIRQKRQAHTLEQDLQVINTQQISNIVQNLMAHGTQQNMPLNPTASQLMVMNNMQQSQSMLNSQMQRNNKKFVELAQKANSSMLASQQ